MAFLTLASRGVLVERDWDTPEGRHGVSVLIDSRFRFYRADYATPVLGTSTLERMKPGVANHWQGRGLVQNKFIIFTVRYIHGRIFNQYDAYEPDEAYASNGDSANGL